MITYKKVYRLKKGMQLEWWVNPRHNDPGKRVTIYAREYLPDNDSRLTDEIITQNMELVGQVPCSTCIDTYSLDELKQAVKELQNFIKRIDQSPHWILGTLDEFVSESARVEAERKAQEEAAARADEIADRKATRAALEKIASLSKKEAGAGVKGILKTLDPIVVAIINNHQMSTKEKLIELRSTDKKFCGYSNVDMGDLLGVSGQRITQILTEMDKEAKRAKKEAENRIDERFVDDRRRPQ